MTKKTVTMVSLKDLILEMIENSEIGSSLSNDIQLAILEQVEHEVINIQKDLDDILSSGEIQEIVDEILDDNKLL